MDKHLVDILAHFTVNIRIAYMRDFVEVTATAPVNIKMIFIFSQKSDIKRYS